VSFIKYTQSLILANHWFCERTWDIYGPSRPLTPKFGGARAHPDYMAPAPMAGVVMCLGRGADLHMVQLMSLSLTISCCSKSRLVLPFWCRLTRVVLDSPREP